MGRTAPHQARRHRPLPALDARLQGAPLAHNPSDRCVGRDSTARLSGQLGRGVVVGITRPRRSAAGGQCVSVGRAARGWRLARVSGADGTCAGVQFAIGLYIHNLARQYLRKSSIASG